MRTFYGTKVNIKVLLYGAGGGALASQSRTNFHKVIRILKIVELKCEAVNMTWRQSRLNGTVPKPAYHNIYSFVKAADCVSR